MRNTIICRFIRFFSMICLSCWSLQAAAETIAPPLNPIALVNGVAITQKSFQQEILAVQAQCKQNGSPMDTDAFDQIKKEILNELIDTELLYQAGQKKGLQVAAATVEKEFLKVRQQFPSEVAFTRGLEKMGMSLTEMKEKLAKSLTIETFITQHITQDISVTEAETRHYYDSRPELFESPLYIRASHILITVPSEAAQPEKEAAKKKLTRIENKLKKGEDFAELAKKYSDGPSKANGGDIGFFERGEMVKPFEDAAFALSKGQTSGIVQTQFGFHLIKTTDRMQDPPIPYKTAQYDIRKKIALEKSKQRLDDYLKDLKQAAKIEIY